MTFVAFGVKAMQPVVATVRLPGRQQRVAHPDHIREIQIIELAAAVVTAAPGIIQAAAEIDHRRPGMLLQVRPDLKGQVILPHGGLQKTEALHQTPGPLFQCRKIIVDPLYQLRRRPVAVQARVPLRAHFSPIQGNDQRLLDRVFLNLVFHAFLSHPVPISKQLVCANCNTFKQPP